VSMARMGGDPENSDARGADRSVRDDPFRSIVTLDGPAGVGKSTTAREVARRLGWRYLDSGALYRAVAFALLEEGIPSKLIADSVAATLMRDGKVDLVVVGADRIAANGDTANKIGTFMLSVVAQRYRVPFYVVAPVSTIDFECPSGKEIQIEERSSREVTHIEGVQVAPDNVEVYNPAFDVTPAENITAIVTEQGVLYPPYTETIAGLKR